jgi:hypothetical protein
LRTSANENIKKTPKAVANRPSGREAVAPVSVKRSFDIGSAIGLNKAQAQAQLARLPMAGLFGGGSTSPGAQPVKGPSAASPASPSIDRVHRLARGFRLLLSLKREADERSTAASHDVETVKWSGSRAVRCRNDFAEVVDAHRKLPPLLRQI